MPMPRCDAYRWSGEKHPSLAPAIDSAFARLDNPYGFFWTSVDVACAVSAARAQRGDSAGGQTSIIERLIGEELPERWPQATSGARGVAPRHAGQASGPRAFGVHTPGSGCLNFWPLGFALRCVSGKIGPPFCSNPPEVTALPLPDVALAVAKRLRIAALRRRMRRSVPASVCRFCKNVPPQFESG